MREARKYFGFTSWFLRVFRRVAGDVPLPLPAKRALHGSRKASASCLRSKRFMRPRRASFFSLHHWGRGTAPAVEGVRRIHPANCKGNRCIPGRRIISRRRPSNSSETDFFGCFYKRHSISASPKVTTELLPSRFDLSEDCHRHPSEQ